jgi:hypothetical protein
MLLPQNPRDPACRNGRAILILSVTYHVPSYCILRISVRTMSLVLDWSSPRGRVPELRGLSACGQVLHAHHSSIHTYTGTFTRVLTQVETIDRSSSHVCMPRFEFTHLLSVVMIIRLRESVRPMLEGLPHYGRHPAFWYCCVHVNVLCICTISCVCT